MKKLLLLVLLFISVVANAQKGISYQAVILDPAAIELPGSDISGQPLVNGNVSVKFVIASGTTIQFEEVQQTKTDAYGLVNLTIGSVASTAFNAVTWDANQKSLQVFVSFNNGTSYTKVSDQKLTYTPYSLFSETAGKLSGTLEIANGGTGAITAVGARANLGLGNVDNTADAAKPISAATQAALDLKATAADVNSALVLKANAADVDSKAPLASPTFTGTVSGVTKTMVGLGLVDNTTDAAKPISAATQTALDLKASTSDINNALTLKANVTALNLKAPLASPTFTGTVSGITKNMVGLGLVDNTADADKPISTATQTALDLKAALASPTFAGTPVAPTAITGTNTTQIATTAYVQNALLNSSASSALTGAIWTSATTGTLNGVAFTIALTSPVPNIGSSSSWVTSLSPSNYSTSYYSSGTLSSTQSTVIVPSGSSWQVVFAAPISNLKLYVYWRSSGIGGSAIYQFDQAFSILNGSNGLSKTNNTLNITGWGQGILEFTNPLTTLNLTADGAACCSGQSMTFATGGAIPPSGTGEVIRSTSATLVTPNLGTPSSVNLTNGIGLPLSTGVSGVLSVVNGGTGLTSFGLNGQVLTSTGSGTMTWTSSASGGGSGVPYSGATGAVNLGAYDLTVNGITVGKGLSSKSSNTAVGFQALNSNSSSPMIPGNNSAFGTYALRANTDGFSNTAIGFNVLRSNTVGSYNTGVGNYVLSSNSTGYQNAGVGNSTLASNQTGGYNTAMGTAAMEANTTGGNNTATGFRSLYTNTTGSNNTAIGYEADVISNNLSNATAIGNGAIVTASDAIQLGNASVTNVKTSGTITAGAVTYPNTDGTSGQVLTTNGSGAISWAAPSTLYQKTHGDITLSNTVGNMVSLNLPAGSYLVTYTGMAYRRGSSEYVASRIAIISPGNMGGQDAIMVDQSINDGRAYIVHQLGITLASAGTVSVFANTSYGSSGTTVLTGARLTAVQVGAVINQ